MKKWHKMVAIFLAFICAFPILLTGCIKVPGAGGGTSGGGSSSGGSSSGGSTGGSGSGGTVTPDPSEDDNAYIEFEEAISGTRATFIVDDATKDNEYKNFETSAIKSAQTMAKDILYRLSGEYIATDIVEEHGIDMDTKASELNYTASDSKYLSGYNKDYDIDFFDYSEDKDASINLGDYIEKYKPCGIDLKNASSYEENGYKFILVKVNETETYYQLDSTISADGIEFKAINLINEQNISLNAKQLISNQECTLVVPGETNEDGTTSEDVSLLGVKIEVVTASGDLYTNYKDTQLKEYIAKVYNKVNSTYSHKVIIGGSGQIVNWNWYNEEVEDLNSFTTKNYELLAKAILAILSNKDLTGTDKEFANELNTKSASDLVKDIVHYGIRCTNDDGTASKEIENIVKYILTYCIGDDLVKNDQQRIYKYNSTKDMYEQINNYENTIYDYSSTKRYNDANLNNLNMNEYAVNGIKYNIYSVSKSGVTGVDNIATTFVGFDNILVYNFSKDNNYFTTGDGKDLGLASNGYQSTVAKLEYAVDYGFQNYINTVETIVSTVCNATLYEFNNGQAKINDKMVYNYVPNIYDYIKNGLYTSLINNSQMDPSADFDSETSSSYANLCPEGEQNYQSVVFYPGTEKYKKFSFLSLYMVFESLQGVENLDLYLRYHKADVGFVKFAVNGKAQDYIKVNNEKWSIKAGKVSELSKTDSQSEYGIELEELLKKRIDIDSTDLTTVNNAIIGTDNSTVINTMINVYKNVKVTMKSLIQGSGDNIKDKNYSNSAYTKNACFPAVKVNTLKGEQVNIYGYENKDEEYLEILFSVDEGSTFNFAYFFSNIEGVK